MRIKIRSSERNMKIWLPTRLLLNPITAAISVKVINSGKYRGSALPSPSVNGERASFFDMYKFFRQIRKCRRILNGQPLVYVESGSGESVEVWL